jgi:hypothetical protein
MVDLRKLCHDNEIVVDHYVRLRGRKSFAGGNILKYIESNPRTGALTMGFWIPASLRSIGQEPWKKFEISGEEVEQLGQACSL